MLEELESRQLLSADLVPLPVEPAPLSKSLLREAVVSTFVSSQPADTAARLANRYEVVFVDPRVPDQASLLADPTRNSGNSRRLEIIVLDADRDGIVQVTEALAERMQIDAVHFVTHGIDGAIQLAGSWLNAKTLAANIDAVASWGHALKEDGDLLFYGCDLAATARGRALIDWISDLTQTDVAASADATGSAVLGGDWTFEYQRGAIEAEIALSAGEQGAWSHILAVPTYVGNGALASGAGAISPVLPAGIQGGDLLLAVFESQAAQAVTINNPNGGTWTLLSNPNVGGSGGNSTRLTVYWSVYNGAQGNPTTNDPGNHVSGFTAAFRGVNTDNPFNATSESTGNSASASITGAATTVRDALVVIVASSDDDADTFGDWANADLTGKTERYRQGHGAGTDGYISMATGVRATAGAYGDSTSTIAGATRWAGVTIALAPDVLAFDDTGTTEEDTVLTGVAPGVLANDVNNTRPPILAGAYVNYDAATDAGGDAVWTDDTLRANWDWSFAASVSPVGAVTRFPGITSAYDFPASGSGATLASFDASGDDDEDATWEIWFKAADLNDQYVLFETGGTTDGVSIFLREAGTDGLYDDLTFAIKDGGASAFVTADLSATIGDAAAITSEFIQVVAVYNKNASGNQDILTLYVNGAATGVTTTQGNQNNLNDWSNGNGAGLGGVNGQINATSVPALGGAAGDYKNLNGQIAQFRFYNNQAFNAAEAAQNFSAVADRLSVTEVNGDAGAVGGPLTLPSGASVIVNADGSYTYDPTGAFDTLAEGQSTTDTFTYTTRDTTGVTDTAAVTITIDGRNDAPTVANAIPDQNATEDSAFSFTFAANTFADVDVGDTLTYAAQLAGGGALPAWLSFTAATRTFSGTPTNADVGTVSIDVIADDGNGGSVTDTFDITVANADPGGSGAPSGAIADVVLTEPPWVPPSAPGAATVFQASTANIARGLAQPARDVADPTANTPSQPVPRGAFGWLVPPSMDEEVNAPARQAAAKDASTVRAAPSGGAPGSRAHGSPKLTAVRPELEAATTDSPGAIKNAPITPAPEQLAVSAPDDVDAAANAGSQAREAAPMVRHLPAEPDTGSAVHTEAKWTAGGLLGLALLWAARRVGVLAAMLAALPGARWFGLDPPSRDRQED